MCNPNIDSREGFSALDALIFGEQLGCNVCPECGRCDPSDIDRDETCDECLHDMQQD